MDARARTIRNILYSGDQYLVPFFQRRYAWKKEHWRRLRDDLWSLLEDGAARQHFLGPLVCTPEQSIPGELPRYLLIDGQQRLTTLSVVLVALRDVARERGLADIAAEVEEDYLTHKRKTDLQRYKVLPRVEDRAVLTGLIDGDVPVADRKSGIYRAWRFFRKEIEGALGQSAQQQASKLLAIIADCLSLVVITITDENPYEIFESLNSTGLPLEQSDLIRNYLFMQIPVAAQEAFNQKSWAGFEQLFEPVADLPDVPQTAFYRNYLMRDGQYVDARQVYVGFKSQNQSRGITPEEQVSELVECARIESIVRRPSTAGDKTLAVALARIASLEITTAHPLLMYLVGRYRREQISLDSLLEALGDVESFVLRRSICGESTRQYNRWFVDAIGHIQDDPVEDLRGYWAMRGWPDDETFLDRLQAFPVYRREPRKLRLMLERLEESRGHKERVAVENLTIEHVLPVTVKSDARGRGWQKALGDEWEALHERWVHTLGNLTLTGYNPEMSNRGFAEKRNALADSNLQLNKSIADKDRWDADAIAERGELLASEVAELWPRPVDVDYEAPEPEPAEEGKGPTIEQRRQIRRDYWSRLLEKVGQELELPSLPKASSRGHVGFATQRGGVRYWLSMNAVLGRVAASLRLRGGTAKENYETLVHARAAIEEELGEALDWHGEGKNTYWASAYFPGVDLTTAEGRERALAWQAGKLADFVRVFGPRLKQLKAWRSVAAKPSATRQLQREFWTAFAERLVEETDLERAQKPSGHYWFDVPLGRSGVNLSNTFSPQTGVCSVRVYFHGKKGERMLEQLLTEREAIEAEIGQAMDWNPRPDNKDKVVVLEQSGSLTDKESWPEILDWMVEMTDRARGAFGGRVRALKN